MRSRRRKIPGGGFRLRSAPQPSLPWAPARARHEPLPPWENWRHHWIRDGSIELIGMVDTLPKKRMATETAASVRGVSMVTNNLEVVDQLRIGGR